MQYMLSLAEAERAELAGTDDDQAPSPGASPPGAPSAADDPCFLHDYWTHPELDEQHLIVHRTEHGFILLNRYPYSNGHLLVALGEGRPRLLDYSQAERAALWALIELATDLMERALNPQGINIGINQGRAAGAGVPQHLHVHLVPRWSGDTNFITVVGDVRVIPDSLDAMYSRYREVAAGTDYSA